MNCSKLKFLITVGCVILLHPTVFAAKNYFAAYPTAEIANSQVQMRLYLPDSVNGYYRASRFDWSGIIAEVNYKGHSYFGEWKDTHDPFMHDDVTGPVEGSIKAGFGHDEAPVGGEFIRLGVGILHKQAENYIFDKTYEIKNHGDWKINKGNDWIEFRHKVRSNNGYAYIYSKRIELLKNEAGFVIKHKLMNTGSKTIETDQFNHNFFTIDNGITGTGFTLKFPFAPEIANDKKSKGFFEIKNNELVFSRDVTEDFVFARFNKLPSSTENNFELINKISGAGVSVKVDKPMYSLVFWARTNVICPENSVFISVAPGMHETWDSKYLLFEKNILP